MQAKKIAAAPKKKVLYARPKPEVMAQVYQWMADTGLTMREVMEHIVEHAQSTWIKLPTKATTLDKQLEAKKRRAARYRKLARVK